MLQCCRPKICGMTWVKSHFDGQILVARPQSPDPRESFDKKNNLPEFDSTWFNKSPWIMIPFLHWWTKVVFTDHPVGFVQRMGVYHGMPHIFSMVHYHWTTILGSFSHMFPVFPMVSGTRSDRGAAKIQEQLSRWGLPVTSVDGTWWQPLLALWPGWWFGTLQPSIYWDGGW